jgi:hypothetical protein
MTRSATCLMRPTSATLEPPYFWTTIDIAELQEVKLDRFLLPFLAAILQSRHSAM